MSAAAASSQEILLIEDEDDLREVLESIFLIAGHSVTSVASGEAALERAEGRKFAVAVTDYRMPGLDGLETMRRLRKMDPSVRIVVVTGYVAADVEEEFNRLGAFAQVRKPFELPDLLALIEKALRA